MSANRFTWEPGDVVWDEAPSSTEVGDAGPDTSEAVTEEEKPNG